MEKGLKPQPANQSCILPPLLGRPDGEGIETTSSRADLDMIPNYSVDLMEKGLKRSAQAEPIKPLNYSVDLMEKGLKR